MHIWGKLFIFTQTQNKICVILGFAKWYITYQYPIFQFLLLGYISNWVWSESNFIYMSFNCLMPRYNTAKQYAILLFSIHSRTVHFCYTRTLDYSRKWFMFWLFLYSNMLRALTLWKLSYLHNPFASWIFKGQCHKHVWGFEYSIGPR